MLLYKTYSFSAYIITKMLILLYSIIYLLTIYYLLTTIHWPIIKQKYDTVQNPPLPKCETIILYYL